MQQPERHPVVEKYFAVRGFAGRVFRRPQRAEVIQLPADEANEIVVSARANIVTRIAAGNLDVNTLPRIEQSEQVEQALMVASAEGGYIRGFNRGNERGERGVKKWKVGTLAVGVAGLLLAGVCSRGANDGRVIPVPPHTRVDTGNCKNGLVTNLRTKETTALAGRIINNDSDDQGQVSCPRS